MHRRLDRAVWQRQMAMRGTVVASMRVVEVAAVTDRRCRMWGATQLAMQEDICVGTGLCSGWSGGER